MDENELTGAVQRYLVRGYGVEPDTAMTLVQRYVTAQGLPEGSPDDKALVEQLAEEIYSDSRYWD